MTSALMFVGTVALACTTASGESATDSDSDSDSATTGVQEEVRYTLHTPLQGTETFLRDPEGALVQSWESSTFPAVSTFLLPGGDLLRTGVVGTAFASPGVGGLLERQSWDGAPLWSFTYSDQDHRLHHDIEPLPSGNILAIAWERKSPEEASAAGRNPATIDGDEGLWPDTVIEIDPSADAIVWEWHVWDHLVQDFDSNAPNFADISARPERIDLNFVDVTGPQLSDWNHFNGIGYNQELDQIVLSAHHFHEIWVIDHSTTSAEAASSSGGRAGRGGDLLYRWGNPGAYGVDGEQQLYHQHDPRWIPDGLPGAGDLTIVNNGLPEVRPYTTVVQITPPLAEDGTYTLSDGTYGPAAPTWEYKADPPESFFTEIVGSAQRLPSGNTLINQGIIGRFFIVTPEGALVWEQNHGVGIFRVDSFAAEDPQLAGQDLTPGEG